MTIVCHRFANETRTGPLEASRIYLYQKTAQNIPAKWPPASLPPPGPSSDPGGPQPETQAMGRAGGRGTGAARQSSLETASAADVPVEKPKPDTIDTGFLRWQKLGPTRPTDGKEFTNGKLAEALGFQLAFSKREWEAFGIKDGQITADDFIRVGASFYKPAPPNKLERPRVKTLMVDLIIHAVDGNAIFDSFLERNIPAKFPQAKAEEKARTLKTALVKIAKKAPPKDPAYRPAHDGIKMPSYGFEQVVAATKGTFTEEELDAVLMFYRKAFSCSYEETTTIKAGLYTGEFHEKSGEREGRGIYEFENGQMYEGEWKHDRFHGEGQYTLRDGANFSGQWRKGRLLCHEGTFTWPSK